MSLFHFLSVFFWVVRVTWVWTFGLTRLSVLFCSFRGFLSVFKVLLELFVQFLDFSIRQPDFFASFFIVLDVEGHTKNGVYLVQFRIVFDHILFIASFWSDHFFESHIFFASTYLIFDENQSSTSERFSSLGCTLALAAAADYFEKLTRLSSCCKVLSPF